MGERQHTHHNSESSDESTQTTSRRAKFMFVFAGDLDAIVDDPEDGATAGQSWLEKFNPEMADELLTSLRQIFSTTYRKDFTDGADQRMLAEIRSLATASLQPFDNALKVLKLKPISVDPESIDTKARIFKYCLVERSQINSRVRFEGKRQPLMTLIENAPADPIFVALRKILSLTFSEIFARREHVQALCEIRELAVKALVPLNDFLEQIGIEPIAMPLRPYHELEEIDSATKSKVGETEV